MELGNIHDRHSSEYHRSVGGCSEGQCQLFVSKNGAEIMRIDTGIVATSLFRVDVPSSSQCVGFLSESSGTEPDDEVKLVKIFRPSSLTTRKEFGRGKVF